MSDEEIDALRARFERDPQSLSNDEHGVLNAGYEGAHTGD
jgi:hypothetical protein